MSGTDKKKGNDPETTKTKAPEATPEDQSSPASLLIQEERAALLKYLTPAINGSLKVSMEELDKLLKPHYRKRKNPINGVTILHPRNPNGDR